MIEYWNNEITEKEARAAYEAILNRNISDGKMVRELEAKLKNLLEIPYVLATPNGTSALALAFMAVGVQPGDEVIVPDITFVATANAAKLLGANVVVSDTMSDKPLINYQNVMNLITEKTKVVVPVDISGRRACTKKLKETLEERKIMVVDDACQAFLSGVQGNYIGKDADIACYSFAISKWFTIGQGGLVATKNKELYEKMKRIKFQGVDSVFECTSYLETGFNFKLTDILASIGIIEFDRIQEKVSNLKKIYNLYFEGLCDIEGISFLPKEADELISNVDIMCQDRNKVRRILEENNIQVRPNGMGLHTANYLESRDTYKNSKKFIEHLLFLPSGPNQRIEHVEKVIDVLRKNKKNLIY